MSRGLQQQLLARLDSAAAALDLPLTREHLERLAVELTPDVAAMLGKNGATVSRFTVATNALAEDSDGGERHVREFAGCTLSIRSDVAEDAPAALLGLELQRQQRDVLALDVPTATSLVVTVRPRSPQAWGWWLDKFEATTCSPEQPCGTTTTGHYGDIAVELRGEGVPDLLATKSAARLGPFMAGHPW
ncbi:hypothetical protein B0675_02050 [Streptomyces sp. M41(2017)]|uniref:hypothetical protein n=1 Tax=Streptomyces sp. M41(2017) TaxID=1955065 RepID=UPI0009BD68ED|nr:hypothetical protein [Streptomyces sp. M41(2017)]OQQ16091.1 hypothetical protein B0675_02050 [Streptomyces sp. M41(2017)]